ncbi:MAG: ribonuclease HI family protein [Coriobacteriia bacterium]|jgi:ribonuclease HI|nr:ribonuclease HI family protein [Coriobacteriia bacterium]
MMVSSAGYCVLHTDGGSRGNPGPAGSGFVLRDAAGTIVCTSGHYLGEATNNQAEYDGLVRGLEAALAHGCRRLRVRMDSELIVKQMSGRYRVKNAGLKVFFLRASELVRRFEDVRFTHVFREENAEADALANQAMDACSDIGDALGSSAKDCRQESLF